MGGHGGLNILPQKRWNVYNFDNREKVRQDEEAAAKEEQLKREQSRKRDAEFRLEKLRQARGLSSPNESAPAAVKAPELESEPKSNHINLFEGIRIFDPVKVEGKGDAKKRGEIKKLIKREKEAPKVVLPEDEKYRLGYGVAGKGVKLPWYMAKPSADTNADDAGDGKLRVEKGEGSKSGGKKTVEEMREERLKRESKEKERERALVLGKRHRDRSASRDRGFTNRSGEAQAKHVPFAFMLTVFKENYGLKEYTLDVRNKQVIVKGDVRLHAWRFVNVLEND
ncbi:hypothetical protein RJ639_026894 [Escallonia herrerae]|uniref:CBF1-interacting co-repressor CIR N-terminal domain-containing protein n=1 Tax=Escallonia herrerae TaxID=1293975 RepID=A0AA88X718_9ASTE|nr:hypothetical protein RJ639_026894 [Escallonia herrerae]